MALEFRRCDAGRPSASELIGAVLDEYDAVAGRALMGPSATPLDFWPPGGAFVVGIDEKGNRDRAELDGAWG